MLLSNSSTIALMNNSSIFKILKRLIFSFLTLLQVLLAINSCISGSNLEYLSSHVSKLECTGGNC